MRFEETIASSVEALKPVVGAARKGATAASACLKMLDGGEIKTLSRKLADAEQELVKALEGLQQFSSSWEDCGIADYFACEEYQDELKAALAESGVDYHEHGDVLYVYPAILRLDTAGRAVKIDKKTEIHLRPRTLAAILSAVQNRPNRFPAARFLASLFKVYKALASSNIKKSEPWAGKSLYLRDIYEIMAAAPGSDYSEQEFVRDMYLLDASGESLEVRGHTAVLEASSSTRDDRKMLSVITRDGQRRLYCTIRFNASE